MVPICESCHEPLESEAEMLRDGLSRNAGYCTFCSEHQCEVCGEFHEDYECDPDDDIDAEDEG